MTILKKRKRDFLDDYSERKIKSNGLPFTVFCLP